MTPLDFTLVTFVISVVAGLLGALLGLGGGIIVVPALTLLLDVHIRYAIGASIVAVIATSSGAAAAYVRERLANLRLGMLLEVATTAGAITGAYLAGMITGRWLYLIFAAVLAYTAAAMFFRRDDKPSASPKRTDPLADRLVLHGRYYDPALQHRVAYDVARTRLGLALSYVAGTVSGLLGIGGGVLKVPVMNVAMHLPMKAATATSNLMIGVTAAASAGVYFLRGDIHPFVAAPVVLGVTLGATFGSLLMGRLPASWLRLLFVILLTLLCVQMLMKGLA
jgi:uncharacterized protein